MEPTTEGRVALVTGAGEGIGLEIARQLVQSGVKVLLNDVDKLKAMAAAAGVGDKSQCIAVGGDAGDVEIVRGLVDQTVAEFGRIDIAIANAGLTDGGPFLELTPQSFERLTSLNLRGSFFLAQAAARQMIRQGDGGRILLMSSVTGIQATPGLAAYGMTKAALQMLARALVLDLGQHGITVNAIAPGAIVTPRNIDADPDYDRTWRQYNPTGVTGYPADIGRAALFLVSEDAGQVNGQTIVVDGGWTAVSPHPPPSF